MGVKVAPDIFAIIDGICHGIDGKDVKGRQNENQREFQEKFEAARGVYILVRKLEDVSSRLP
jgi:hypothetical protein